MTVNAIKWMYNIAPRDVGIHEYPYLRLNYDDDGAANARVAPEAGRGLAGVQSNR